MGKKLLIVEDELHIRTLLEQALEDLEDDFDVEVLSAADGEEGLAMIREHKPQAVFLDIMMPKKKRLRGLQIRQGRPGTQRHHHCPAHGQGPGSGQKKGPGAWRLRLHDQAL